MENRSDPCGPVIAIDGPSGTGKSTLARLLAKSLHCRTIDTGAMYRAVAVFAAREGVDADDLPALLRLLGRFKIDYVETDQGLRVFLREDDISEEIRRPGVGEAASKLSRFPEVRELLVELQRQFAARGSVVMEGRDIGSVVLPGADLKIFLDADPEERARRRQREWQAKGIGVRVEEVRKEMFTRDRRDRTRETAPLVTAADAIRIDTTELTPGEVLDLILRCAEQKGIRADGCDFRAQSL